MQPHENKKANKTVEATATAAPHLDVHKNKRKKYNMGLLSSVLGNAGAVAPEKLDADYGQLLTEEEKIEIGFAVFRDTFIFTDKRLMIVDVQGMTGKKIEYLSIPYSKVTKFSVETSGRFDPDAELKIWVGSETTPIQKKFNKKVNIYDVQKVLARFTLV